MAGVAVIRGHSGSGEATIAVKGHERFGVRRGVPYRQTTRSRKPSRYGQRSRGEWRVSYALAEDDSWYSVSADYQAYDCAGAPGMQKQTGQGLAVADNGDTSSAQGCSGV